MSWITLFELYTKNSKLFHKDGEDLTNKETDCVSAFMLYMAQATSALLIGSPIFRELAKVNGEGELELFLSTNDVEHDIALQHLICLDALERVKDICALERKGAPSIESRINAEPVITFFSNFVAHCQPNAIINPKNFTSDVMRKNIEDLSLASQSAQQAMRSGA